MTDYDVNVNLNASVKDFQAAFAVAAKSTKALSAAIKTDLGRSDAVRLINSDLKALRTTATQAGTAVKSFSASTATAMRSMATSVSTSMKAMQASMRTGIQGSPALGYLRGGKDALFASATAGIAGLKASTAQAGRLMNGAAAAVASGASKMASGAAAGVGRMATVVKTGVASAHTSLVSMVPSIGAAEAAFVAYGNTAKAAMGVAVAATKAGAVVIGQSMASAGAAATAGAVAVGSGVRRFGERIWDLHVPIREFGTRLKGDFRLMTDHVRQFMNFDDEDMSNYALRWGSRRAMVNGLATDFARFGAVGVAALAGTAWAAINWESAMAGVAKAAELNVKQTAALSEELLKLTLVTPETAQNIAEVAENAGQLGVPTAAIRDFTEVMVAMGVATNLTSEQASDGIARLMNIMGKGQSEIYNFVENIGSVIVKLGNTSAATEKEIVNMAHRIGAAAVSIDIHTADVLAFATAVSELGVRSEAGGTAVSRTFRVIDTAVKAAGDDLRIIAETAGYASEMVGKDLVSASERFAKAWDTDAAYATADFIEGLGDIQASGGNAAETLRSLGIRGERQLAVIMGLVANQGSLRKALDRANTEWERNEALMEEAEKRYNTTASKIAMARNALYKFSVDAGAVLLPVIADIATGLGTWLKAMDEMPSVIKTVSMSVVGMTSVVMLGVAALAKMAVMVKEFQALEAVGGFTGKLGPALGAVARFGTVGLATAVSVGVLASAMAGYIELTKTATASTDDVRESIAKLAASGDLQKFRENYAMALDPSRYMEGLGMPSTGLTDFIFGKLGGKTDEVLKKVTEDIDVLATSFKTLKEGTTGTGLLWGREFYAVEETTRKVSQALASMAGLGRGDKATSAFREIWKAMQSVGYEAKDAIKYMPEYADQMKALLVQAGLYTDVVEEATAQVPYVENIDDMELLNVMLGNVTGKMRVWEAQTGRNAESLFELGEATLSEEDRIAALTDAVTGLVSAYTGLKVAEDAVASSLSEARALLKEDGYAGAWDKRGEKARELHSSLDQVVSSYQKLIEAQLAEDDGGTRAARTAIRMKENLEDLATQMTGSAKEAQKLIDQFEIWPGDIVTTMYVEDEAAAAKLKTIKESINNLPAEAGLKIAGALNGPGGIDAAYKELARQMALGAKGAGDAIRASIKKDQAGGMDDVLKEAIGKQIEEYKTRIAELDFSKAYAPNAKVKQNIQASIDLYQGLLEEARKKLRVPGDLSDADLRRSKLALEGLSQAQDLKLKLQAPDLTDSEKQKFRETIDKYNAIATLTARLTLPGVSSAEKGRLRDQIDSILADTPLKAEVEPEAPTRAKLKKYLDELKSGLAGEKQDVELNPIIDAGSKELAALGLQELADNMGTGWLATFYAETDPEKRAAAIRDLLVIANNNGSGYKVPYEPTLETQALTEQMQGFIADQQKAQPPEFVALIKPQMDQINKSNLQDEFEKQSPEWKARYFAEPDPNMKTAMLADIAAASEGATVDFTPVVPSEELTKALALATADQAPTVDVQPNVVVSPESLEKAKSDIAAGVAGAPATVSVTADTSKLQESIKGVTATATISVIANPESLATADGSIQGVASKVREAQIKAVPTNLTKASDDIDAVANKKRTATINVTPRIGSASGVITIGPDSITVRVGPKQAYGGLVESLSELFQKRGSGGQIKGYSPHIRADNIPTLLTAGEYVHQVPAVRYYGAEIMQALNEMRIPRSLFGGYAYGGQPPVQRSYPGYAYGGSPQRNTGSTHSEVNEYSFGDITVDAKDFEGIQDMMSFVGMLRRKYRQAGASSRR